MEVVMEEEVDWELSIQDLVTVLSTSMVDQVLVEQILQVSEKVPSFLMVVVVSHLLQQHPSQV
jgi:hypothetical protein